MAGRLVFITGGARSGKSSFAEGLAQAHGGRVAYIATAAATDPEMVRRIELHRRRRPEQWTTLECRGSMAQAITQAGEEHDLVLVDCLTVYLARLLPYIQEGETVSPDVQQALDQRTQDEMEDILGAVEACGCDVIVVSNEVGAGLVPPYPAGRLYRDMVGRANRQVAQAATCAYLVVCGMPVDLRMSAATPMPWGKA